MVIGERNIGFGREVPRRGVLQALGAICIGRAADLLAESPLAALAASESFPKIVDVRERWPANGAAQTQLGNGIVEVPVRIGRNRVVVIDGGYFRFGMLADEEGKPREYKALYNPTSGESINTLLAVLETVDPNGSTINLRCVAEQNYYFEFENPKPGDFLDVVHLQKFQAAHFKNVRLYHPGATARLIHGIVLGIGTDQNPGMAFEDIRFTREMMDIRIRQVDQQLNLP